MVRIKTPQQRTAEDIEEIFFGDTQPDECKLMAEIHGIQGRVDQRLVEERLDEYFGDDVIVEYGKPIELEWPRKRANYRDIQRLDSELDAFLMNQLGGRPRGTPQVQRMAVGDSFGGDPDYRDFFKEVGMENVSKAMREYDMFLKPFDDEFVAQQARPRPSIAFELVYDVPRDADLRDTLRGIKERVRDGMAGQIGEIRMMEDRESIIVVPLKTLINVDDFGELDFNMEGIADEVANDILGTEEQLSPRLERMVATCIMVD